jgi:hypothetical protein
LKEIKINCPYCNKSILIKLDDNFNVTSVSENDKKVEMSQEEIASHLRKNGIEFG